ncbi:DUF6318 family protein [Gleimia hominis]|uniref:DUF6318 family protein n=1 Tax=Gleimia hominis TaxID=595468 RepID=A0ABU3IEU8_9ACTO|nr:DUF6318 family protein [Gleimia hominis]MDT3767765.1 DUF6318 family protein [Gleimia hominis]
MLRTLFGNRVSRLVLVLVFLLVCVLTVSACGGKSSGEESKGAVGASPVASPSGGGSSSPSVSASEEAVVPPPPVSQRYPHDRPEYPQEGYVHSQEGAIKVAQYFTELIGYSYSTLDTRPLEKLCDKKTAERCRKLIDLALSQKDSHAWIKGMNTTNTQFRAAGPPDNGMPGEISVVHTAEGVKFTYFDKNDGPQIKEKEYPLLTVGVNLKWSKNHWKVVDGEYLIGESEK